MIVTDLRAPPNLAAAAEHVPPKARAPAPAAGSVSRAHPQPLPVPGGPILLRALLARRAPPPARKTRPRRPPSPGYAPKPPAKAPPSAKKPSEKDPLAFLRDPSLSIEDKLIQLLGYLNARWDKEIEDKMDRIAASESAKKASEPKSSGSSGSKKKSGGLLGGISGFVEAVVSPAMAALRNPAVHDLLKQVGGPVLAAGATALGAPELAPFLLENGPGIVDAASKLASSLDGAAEAGSGGGSPSGGGSSSSGGGTSKAAGGGAKALSDSEMQMTFMQIQRIQQKQQEMFGLVSSILKSNHDTRMGVVNNIR